jgi:hypothetical protein
VERKIKIGDLLLVCGVRVEEERKQGSVSFAERKMK